MSNQISQSPKVFISYSWDSDNHKDNVLKLADRLRHDGIDCNIDQYEVAPPEGWPRWMSNQIDKSDFVLVVCTEQYKRRFQGKEEPGKGKGVTWEGAIINQVIYDYNQRKKTKFIPIIFSSQQANYIPPEISGFTRYLLNTESLDSDRAYEDIYRHLTGQPSNKKPTLGKLKSLPPRQRQQFESQNKQNKQEMGFDSNQQSPVSNSIKDEESQQKNLTELYDRARRLGKARQWKKVISIFQQMQSENLSFFDPDGLYRSARHELVKRQEQRLRAQREQERKKKELEDLYNQGVGYLNHRYWHEARQKFEEILQREPNDRNLQTQVQEKLSRVQEQLKRKKWLSMGLIVIGWLISGSIVTKPWGQGIGGFTSGFAIWLISQRTEPSTPSKQVWQLCIFVLMGVVIGVIAGHIAPNSWIAAIIGIGISFSMMFWQLRR